MEKVLVIVVLSIFFAMTVGSVCAYEVTQGPSEVIYYDASKAYNGYTLFKTGGGMGGRHSIGWLIDMEGNVVHMWPDTVGLPQLLPDGHLLDYVSGRARDPEGGWIKELDWDGKLVRMWKIPADRPDIDQFHHDQQRIFNKKLKQHTIISLVWYKYTRKEAIANGADPNKVTGNPRPCGMVEMDMDGNIIWEWRAMDHYIQDYDATKPNYVGKGKTIADYPGKFDMNWGSGLAENANALDYNEKLDLILYNGKGISEMWIIDHGNTFIPGDPEGSIKLAASDAGDILYRWGNPSVYGAGEGPWYKNGQYSNGDTQLFNTHDGQWIDEGLPGAGHLLVFDNGFQRIGGGFSTIVEVNPYDGPVENGVFLPEMKAGHTTSREYYGPVKLSNQIVWLWNEKIYQRFSYGFASWHISGCQRLPNGNTLMCGGEDGHMIEVTYGDQEKGVLPEIVWEYVNPETTGHWVQKRITVEMNNTTYRAYRYGPDYPGLKGKDLIPKGTITELAAQGKITAPKARQRDKGKGDKGKKGGKK
jgi:hypothetical protein